jgi:predicted MFS family arabinose efflux permease
VAVPGSPVGAFASDFKPGEVLRTRTFYLMWIAYALGCSAGLMVISQLVPFAQDEGIKPGAASTALLIGAAGNVAGRTLSGWLSDALGRLNVLRLMIGVSVVAMPLLYASVGNLATFFAMVFVVYWCFGTQLSVNASTAADFWGTRNAGINYGLLYTAYGMAGIIGPRIGGVLFDRHGHYGVAFTTAAALAAVALVCELLARRPQAPARA